jgi:hypothetical protein
MAGKVRGRRVSTWIESLENRQLLSATSLVMQPTLTIEPAVTSTEPYGYNVPQIEKAYGISPGTSSDGAGQTIAIIDAYNDPDIASDLTAFDGFMGIAAPPSLKVVNQSGGTSLPANNASWDVEIALDVEWAHAVAPDASILLVEASSATLGNLLNAVNYARNVTGVSVISMSWGSTEFSTETSYDSYFTTPSGHTGITFVAASGDEGGEYGPLWPAISPNVLSVGGTTLSLNSSGYVSETAWSDSTGGVSAYESEPAYQEVAQGEGRATAPDVAFDANPATGADVFDSVSYDGQSGWFEVGGTSLGAPAWSGLVADADQGHVAKGLGTLNSATTLSTLFGAYTSSATYSADFHDVSSGNNGVWLATTGYDAVTGLGSPKGAAIVSLLAGATNTTASASQAAATLNGKAVGPAAMTGGSRQDATIQSFDVGIAAAQHDSWNFAASLAATPTLAWVAEAGQPAAPADAATAVATPSLFGNMPLPSEADVVSDGAPAAAATAGSAAASVMGTNLAGQPAAVVVKVAASLTAAPKFAGVAKISVGALASALGHNENYSLSSKLAALMGAGVLVGAYGAKARKRKVVAAEVKSPVLEGELIGS